jgi:large subunit ribosomal protein L9
MKIIFLKDIPRIARKHEVKEVADGYGRYLLANKSAELATKNTLARIEKKILTDATQKKAYEELLLKNLEVLDSVTVIIARKSNTKGHLFASVHEAEILEELKRVTRLDVHPGYAVLEKPVKELGTYEIPVIIGKRRATFTLVVNSA